MSTERRINTLECSENEIRRHLGSHDEILKEHGGTLKDHQKSINRAWVVITSTGLVIGFVGWLITQGINILRLIAQ